MIDTRYDDGTGLTTTQGLSYASPDGDLSRLLRGLVMRRLAPQERTRAVGGGNMTSARVLREGQHNEYVDPLADQKARDRYEMTRRGAATRPTGLGPGMIPGMAVDPRLLPSSMQPSGSSFANVPGASPAGLSPSRPELEDESSNSGFDYMSPVERARWAAVAARSAR